MITEGNSLRKDIGKLYFPLEDAVIYLESEIFGEKKPFDLDNLYWNESSYRFFTFGDHGKHLVSVPGEHILLLPKRNPKTGKKVKTKGICRYSVNHVGVGTTTPDRLCSTDPKRRASLNTYVNLAISMKNVSLLSLIDALRDRLKTNGIQNLFFIFRIV